MLGLSHFRLRFGTYSFVGRKTPDLLRDVGSFSYYWLSPLGERRVGAWYAIFVFLYRGEATSNISIS